MPKCKSCDAAISWVTTRTGRTMPIDAAPNPHGNVRLRDDGRALVLGGDDLTNAQDEGVELFTSHFATCPGAAQHRKPKPLPED